MKDYNKSFRNDMKCSALRTQFSPHPSFAILRLLIPRPTVWQNLEHNVQFPLTLKHVFPKHDSVPMPTFKNTFHIILGFYRNRDKSINI